VRERAAELQLADANKSRFLAVLSHELRNPMAPLLNGLTLLNMEPNPAAAAPIRAMMGRQIDHLRRLIDDLLDVSRIDRGKLELERERISVDAFVRHAVETTQPAIDAKSHKLVVRYAAEPVFVNGDHVRLSQVVSNLLSNAARFTPQGGSIEVEVRATELEALVLVKDSGIGFEQGDELRMFDMFVQLEGARTLARADSGWGSRSSVGLRRCTAARWRRTAPGPVKAASSCCTCRVSTPWTSHPHPGRATAQPEARAACSWSTTTPMAPRRWVRS
jgi:signal transduction histidine kinase